MKSFLRIRHLAVALAAFVLGVLFAGSLMPAAESFRPVVQPEFQDCTVAKYDITEPAELLDRILRLEREIAEARHDVASRSGLVKEAAQARLRAMLDLRQELLNKYEGLSLAESEGTKLVYRQVCHTPEFH